MNRTCVLIQTCDNYEFLWEGLSLAWKHNWDWKNLNVPVFLLTEEKNANLPFRTLKYGMQGVPPQNFSTRMMSALKDLQSEFDHVLYSQDDFWPMFPVRSDLFIEGLSFLKRENASCLHLNEYCHWYNYRVEKTAHRICDYPVYRFLVGSPFYYNHQAAFWKIEDLISIQKEGEAPYENECRGTERSWSLKTANYFLNYAWYKPAYVNQKGNLSPVAAEFVKDWRWKSHWEQQ